MYCEAIRRTHKIEQRILVREGIYSCGYIIYRFLIRILAYKNFIVKGREQIFNLINSIFILHILIKIEYTLLVTQFVVIKQGIC
jgi:hypothetical protein